MPNITWDLIYRDRGVARGLNNVAAAHDKAEKRAKAFKVAVGVGLAVASVAAIKFGRDSVRAYAEAETAQAKLGFAFRQFPKLADTNQAALNRLNTELAKKTRFDDDATASGQAVLAQFKLTGQQITELTPLLQDYAARTGKDLPAAANDLGKAMLGQGRALKVVGINFKDAGSTGANFDQIMKGLRTQVGGFAEKEGKTAAGQAAILSNQFGELQEAVGRQLLPGVSAAVGVLTKLVEVVGDNSRVIVPLVGTVGGLTAAIWLGHKAAKAYAVVHGLMGAAAASNNRIFTGLAGVVGKAGPWGVAIGAGATLLGLFAGQQEMAKRETRGFTDQLTFQKDALDDSSRQMLVKKLATEGVLDASKRAGVTEAAYVRALLQGGSVRDKMIEQLTDTGIAARANVDAFEGDIVAQEEIAVSAFEAADKLKLMGRGLDDSKRAADLAASAYEGTADSGDVLTTAQDKLTAAQKKLSAATATMRRELTLLKGEALSASEAEIGWQESIDAATRSVKDNGRTLDTNTEKGRNNKTSLIGMIRSLDAKTVADIRNNKSTKEVTARFAENRTQLIKVATQMTGNKKEATRMIDEFLSTPKELKTKVSAPTKSARAEIKELKAQIREIKDRLAKITYSTNAGKLAGSYNLKIGSTGFGLGSRADGGPIHGVGGPRQDNVMGIDRATGRQTAWVSSGEYVVNAKSYARNKSLVEAINAGDVPGLARGGRLNDGPLNRGTRLNSGEPHGSRIDIRSSVPSHGRAYRAIGDELGGRLGRDVGTSLAGGIYAGLKKGFDAKAAEAAGGGDPGGPAGTGGRNRVRWKGGTFTERFVNTLKRAQGFAGRGIPVTQGGFSRRVAASGTSHSGDAIDTVWNAAILRGLRKARVAAWHRTPRQGPWGHHIHGVPLPGAGYAGGSGKWQAQDYLRGGNGLAGGGMINRRGLIQVAENGPERVLSTTQTKSFENLVRVLDRRGVAGITINISPVFPNYVGDRNDLKRHLVNMGRSGDLKAALQAAGVR